MNDYNFRIIAQTSGAIYLCANWGEVYPHDTRIIRAVGAIRECNSGDSASPLPWIIIRGDVIIEPIEKQVQPAKSTGPSWGTLLTEDTASMSAEHIRHGDA